MAQLGSKWLSLAGSSILSRAMASLSENVWPFNLCDVIVDMSSVYLVPNFQCCAITVGIVQC